MKEFSRKLFSTNSKEPQFLTKRTYYLQFNKLDQLSVELDFQASQTSEKFTEPTTTLTQQLRTDYLKDKLAPR